MDNELEQLRLENGRLRKALEAKQRVATSPDRSQRTKQPHTDLTQSCRENGELLQDLARYSEGLYSEKFIRRKYRDVLNNDDWNQLGSDEDLIEKIELEKVRRERNGQAKRERAQQLVTKAPNILDTIMNNPAANERHRIDAIKALDSIAEPAPGIAQQADRFSIVIDLGEDHKLTINKPIQPGRLDDNGEIIDITSQEAITDGSKWKE